ncbi:ABC transporter permease [Nesterenkonia alkaliphila]|uniref:FtsX-like permease family protein n=1 Tax=Nesterenkonia alkaliphila TaxID=1463631 RepID=A0A7K1UMQ9_9MICC|nr:FtsX family ABC transporter permease [Nesterenkonia alkaliphila]MVT27750.1 FtsX-like permease family protein [Nesterenkonia alkaliphila]GFZ87435.1 hypothetical protein GCM10011359_15890 [Nesterenkonia alkaliphila]
MSTLTGSREYPLVEGRLPQAADELLVSESAAQWQDLAVGDTYQAEAVRWEMDDSYTVVDQAQYTVVGIAETSVWSPEAYLTAEGMDRVPVDPEADYGFVEPAEIRVVLPESVHGDRAAQEAVQQQIAELVGQLIASGELDMLAPASATPEAGAAQEDPFGIVSVSQLQIATSEQIVDLWVAERTGDAQLLRWVALGFGSIAVFVSALVIANTFQVIVASRQRTMALIRAVGGTAAQLRWATLAEGAVLGLLGGAAGVLLGWGIAQGFVVAMNFLGGGGEGIPAALPNLIAMGVGLGLGLVMAVGSALYPAFSAGRISPMIALRPADVAPPENRGSTVRLVLGALLTAVGLAAVLYAALGWPASEPNPELDYYGMFNADPVAGLPFPVIGLGGGILGFLGVLVLAKTIVPPLAEWLGTALAALRPLKVPARLAGQNARQVPGRTAATSSALLVGVTLVATMITGAATAQKLLYTELAESYPVDGAVAELEEDQWQVLQDSPVVTEVMMLPGLQAQHTEDIHWQVLVLEDAEFSEISRLPLDQLQEDGPIIYAGWNAFAQADYSSVSETLMLELPTGQPAKEFPVQLASWLPHDVVAVPQALLPPGDRDATPGAGAVFRVADDAQYQEIWQLHEALGGYSAQASVEGAAYRAETLRLIDAILLGVLALLGASVLVAVLGVSNTLSLSVFERQREAALLRANGMTRRALGATIGIEALLLAAVALLLGTGMGALFGWAGVSALVAREDWTVAPEIPWLRMAAVWAATLLASLAAAWLPARRLSRVQPAAGLSRAA